jgi:putative component of toxin-antitoxin plasmid stabilization module
VKVQAKITLALDRLKHGGAANVAGVGESALELELDWGPGYHINFGSDSDSALN